MSAQREFTPEPRQFLLLCETPENCTFKERGVEGTMVFADVLEAIGYAYSLRSERGSTLTVYNQLGHVSFVHTF